MALGRDEAAVREWSLALDDDPEDPGPTWDGPGPDPAPTPRPSPADLEEAADWAADNPMLLPRITAAYALCLGSRPDRFPQWLALARRAWSGWIASVRS